MASYKTESHLRSFIKGITWRIIATTDTVLVVLLITCLTGNCSIEIALQIGFFEFIFKFIAYYIHERIWQNLKSNVAVTKSQTFKKTLSWRILATSMTFVISGTILNAFNEIALYIALTELFTKFALYYLHERLWLKLPLGRIRQYVFGKKK